MIATHVRRISLILLCLALLAGCGITQNAEPLTPAPPPPTPSQQPSPPSQFSFTEENFPRIDGSTATIPLIEAVTACLLDKPRSEIDISVSKTSGAYVALAENNADILLVYDGGDETRALVKADELFETVPIGKDALVFLVNEDNPVSNLTTEQAQKIFSGEYVNWSEVGGNDEPIRAYQRGIGSGSQALMDKLVMDGLTMANPAMVPVIESMGGLIDVVADFAGGPTGIGYNVYFYVTEMRSNDYIKILSIDGVEPAYETIQSGEYPFVSEFYSVIRADEPSGSPARALHEWMLTEEAQNLMVSENYVALYASPSADAPRGDGRAPVYPDGEAPTFFQGVNLYEFEERDDYGKLYFYLGSMRQDERSETRSLFYGLCTATGEIVTMPIYTTPLLLTDSFGNNAYFCHRTDLDPLGGTYPVLLFATDGSWVQEFDGAAPFFGFTGVADLIRNADVLAVKQSGKWGAVNMKGELVIPFERNTHQGIYAGSNADDWLTSVTADRFLRGSGNDNDVPLSDLYDGNSKLIASGVRGIARGMAGSFFVTVYWGDSSIDIFTYTLDGDLIAELTLDRDDYSDAEAFGDFVRVNSEKNTIICDRELNVIHEFPNLFDETSGRYISSYQTHSTNVLFNTDAQAFLHRTYLPDGTRLATWHDSMMGE